MDLPRSSAPTRLLHSSPTRQTEVAKIADLAAASKITGFPNGASGASGFIVNCQIIAQL